MKLFCLSVAVITAALAAAASVASARNSVHKTSATSEVLTLDSYYPWNRHYTPPVASTFKVVSGKYDVATVSGTFSYYSAINYSAPQHPWNVVCGTPEPSSQYSGSLGGDGPVGFDAEFVFARPWRKQKCEAAHLPIRWGNFQMNSGSSWAHPNILGALPTAPTGNHTYSFAVVGNNKRVQFRLFDVLTRDNYGLVKISLAPATSSDCSSYVAFGFSSEGQCVTALS